MGISTSRLRDRRAYRGTIDGEYRMRSPSAASRSRTRGWRTATGPMPVMISRCGRWPWRTTRCRPVSVLRSLCFARNSATSASTAWVSSARAPLRRISVRESAKAPGWASLMTLLSDTAYHSFIGEVEALNTTTIRRLTRSRRHQLLAIARVSDAGRGDLTSQTVAQEGHRSARSEALRGCPWLRSKACRPVDQCLPSGGDFEDAKGCFERQTGSPDFSKWLISHNTFDKNNQDNQPRLGGVRLRRLNR